MLCEVGFKPPRRAGEDDAAVGHAGRQAESGRIACLAITLRSSPRCRSKPESAGRTACRHVWRRGPLAGPGFVLLFDESRQGRMWTRSTARVRDGGERADLATPPEPSRRPGNVLANARLGGAPRVRWRRGRSALDLRQVIDDELAPDWPAASQQCVESFL